MTKSNVSVIIPVKNRAHLLPVTLDNILQQTLKPYEVIVVDDNSQDHIKDVIKAYQSAVIFTTNKGVGPGAARNTGLKIATGNIIQFFDSDDLMTKNKLQVQSDLLQEKKADFAYGPFVKARFDKSHWIQEDLIMQYYPIPSGLLDIYVLKGWCNITQSALFRSELVKEVGYWKEDLMTHEDYEYWYRIGKVAKSFVHENKSCVLYRQHQQQITDLHVTESAKWRNEIKAFELIRKQMATRPSLINFSEFNGKEYGIKSGYIKKFGHTEGIAANKRHRLLFIFFKICNKIGQFRTGTPWQKMHGVLKENNKIFNDYITQLN